MPLTKHTRARRNLKPKRKVTKAIKLSKEFHVFQQLPIELRFAIWQLSIVPRIITIKNASYEEIRKRYMFTEYVFITVVAAEAKNAVPSILHACQESRALALSEWSPEFEPQLGHPIYFNWKRDTLFMENWDDVVAFYGGPTNARPEFGHDMTDVEKNLRRLVIGEHCPIDFAIKKVISRLYNLETLVLPRPYGQGFAAVKVGHWVADKIHEWMEEMQEVKSKQEGVDTTWMLPKIEFMSKKEFSEFETMAKRDFRKSELEAIAEKGNYKKTTPADEDDDDKTDLEEMYVEPRFERESRTSALSPRRIRQLLYPPDAGRVWGHQH